MTSSFALRTYRFFISREPLKNAHYSVNFAFSSSPYSFVRLLRKLLVSLYSIIFQRFPKAAFRWLLLFILLCSSFVPSSFAASTLFVDIPEDYVFLNALTSLKSRNIIQGYPDQSFRPDQPVTRAEFVKMAIVSAQLTVEHSPAGTQEGDKSESSPFSDVSKNDWFYPFVQIAQKNSIVSGYTDKTFRPHQTISRVEALKIALELYVRFVADQKNPVSLKNIKPHGDFPLPPDIQEKDWFMPYTVYARDLWVMTDYDDGSFRPHEKLTRGMAAEVLFRADQVTRNGLDRFDISSEWKVFQSAPGHFSVKVPHQFDIIPESTRSVLWKKDPNFERSDYEIISPLSAKLIIRSPQNESFTSVSQYFESVKALTEHVFGENQVSYTEVSVSGNPTLHVKVPSEGVENWYVFLPADEKAGTDTSPRTLVMYGQFGKSSLTPKMRETLRLIVRSLQYLPHAQSDEKDATLEKLLSEINAQILAEGKGRSTLDLLEDVIIIETDEIGVGTGPVDYYYSGQLNITLKYERTSDTILAIRGMRTTLF